MSQLRHAAGRVGEKPARPLFVATTWLITREGDDARSEREAWTSRGIDAVLVPCVETQLRPWPWPAAETAHHLTFFTSRRAVASWSTSARPPLDVVAALSPSTARALEAERTTPTITAAGGAVSLAEAVLGWWTAQHKPPTRVRYPTSDAGLQSPEQTDALRLLAKLGEIDRRIAYGVFPPADLRSSLERGARGDWAISFASPSAVHHFFASGAAFERAPSRVTCHGDSTERAWNVARPEGWPVAVNSSAFPLTTQVAS